MTALMQYNPNEDNPNEDNPNEAVPMEGADQSVLSSNHAFHSSWEKFLKFAKKKYSSVAYNNWVAPIEMIKVDVHEITLRVPNIFVQEYLLLNMIAIKRCPFILIFNNGNL